MAKLERSMFRPLDKSRRTLTVASLLMLIVAYIYGSKAIDTGSWFDYFLTVLALLLAVRAAIWAFKLDGTK